MKKIITLLFAAAAFGSVEAQTSKEEARKVVLGGSKTTTQKAPAPGTQSPRDVVINGGTSTEASRQAEIDKVNREADAAIASIRKHPTLSQAEKDRAIASIERERARRISEIRNSGSGTRTGSKSGSDDDYDGRDNDDRDIKKAKKNKKAKKVKGNNGKHLGWEKGVGNPHKNGGSPKGKKKG